MGFYAAPLYNLAGATLASGYTPPAGNAVSVAVSSAGQFAYRAPLYNAASAILVGGYAPPAGNPISVVLARPLAGSGQAVLQEGWDSGSIGAPAIKLRLRYITVSGLDAHVAGIPHVRNAVERVFPWDTVSQNLSGALLRSGYTIPPGNYQDATLGGYNNHLSVGRANVQLGRRTVLPEPAGTGGIVSGGAELRNLNRYVTFAGNISASAFGLAGVVNAKRPIFPAGASTAIFGAATIWNRRKYVLNSGYSATLWGQAYVQGGVKTVAPTGLAALFLGAAVVINTRADQTARPASIPAPGMGAVTVSPRFLRPGGIYGTATGTPRVQFPPQPTGWLSSAFGYPIVEFKTKVLLPGGIGAYAEGFPRVADRARKVFHAASPVSAVFGDVQVRVKNFRVQVPGLPPPEIAPWTEARNSRRYLGAFGLLSQAFGVETTAHNKTPSVAPAGFDAQQFGRSTHMVVGWRIRSVVIPGVPVPFPQFGTASLWKTPSLSPSGLVAPAVPAPTVWAAVRHVLASGSDMQRFGGATAWFSYRFVVAKDRGIAGTNYGSARVEHGRRGIAMLGAPFMAFGASWVSRRVRALAPLGVGEPLLSRHQIGGTRWLGPEGFEATRWLTRITPENRQLFPKTFDAEYGMPAVQNRKRPLFLTGFRTYPDDWRHWGAAKIWNRRQVVALVEDQESGLWPPPWPQWTAIENRNKVMRVSGFDASRIAGPAVENGARPVQPSGIAFPVLPEYQKTGAVTHRVRALMLDGMDAPALSRWAVMHNAARPILPQGVDAALLGRPGAVNLRRSYLLQGLYSTEFGYPFIADRIRTLSFESRYGIAPPRVELPRLHLHTRYVEAPGVAAPGVGHAALTVFFRRATPRWTHRDWFGDPFVRNKTPELLTRGHTTEEFGGASIRLQWRHVAADGANTQLFGLTRISDRKQHLLVAGLNLMLVSDKVTVRRFGEAPVTAQYIDLRGFMIDGSGAQQELDAGHGIPPPHPAVGLPDLLKGYIFHGKGPGGTHDMLEMGRPTVAANSIRVEPGIFDFYIGEPFVSLRVRKMAAPSLGQLIVPSSDAGGGVGSWGKPRLTPHTIYAVLEASAQAMRNHGMNPFSTHPVHWPTTFGHARLSMWNGNIRPHGIDSSGAAGSFGTWGVGRPRLMNTRQVITTYGTLMQRLGWPVIPGPQTILIEEPITGYAAGRTTVARPPYVGPSTIRAGALSFQSFGAAGISHRNRSVRPPGWFSQVFSATYGSGSNTYLPQTLTVGPKMPVKPGGAEVGRYGEPWVSLRVREVQADGHDSFESEYDYQAFDKRMRVRNANDSWGGRRSVLTHGHQSSRVGAPGVRPGTHYIRPDGNSDQHRKGVIQ